MRPFIALLLLLLVVTPLHAQYSSDEPTPLIFWGRGLFVMDEGDPRVSPWRDCGDGGPSMVASPAGGWVARLVGADLRLCHLQTREVINVQAPNEALRERVWASLPSWAPDGSAVAWSVKRDDEHVLFIYDLAEEEARTVVEDLPISPLQPQVLWGRSGILVVADSSDPNEIAASLYSPDGELLAEDLSNGTSYTFYFWLTDENGEEYLGRYIRHGMGDAIHPLTSDIALPSSVEMYSPLAPDGLSIEVTYEGLTVAHLPDGETVPVNDLHDWLGDFIPFLPFQPHNISIAPDGEAFAIFDLAGVVWRGGEVTELPPSIPKADGTGLVWGPVTYRVRGGMLSPLG